MALLLWACAVDVDVGGAQVCTVDADCGALALCVDARCTPCPAVDVCPAPLNQFVLMRNGCASCTFAPPSQCMADSGCSEGLACVKGVRCALGCSGLGCCSNSCSVPGCVGDSPVGCAMPCGADPSCSRCIAGKCTCAQGQWRCVAVCTSPDFEVGCTAPAF